MAKKMKGSGKSLNISSKMFVSKPIILIYTVPDIVEIDVTKDGDVCNQEELNSLYKQPYFCSARKAVGLDKLYILHIDCHWKSNQLAAALSNNSIHLTTTDTLDKISTFIVHEQHIIDIHFNPVDPNFLFTASSDGTIRVWDIRNTHQGCVQEFKGRFC
jgi:WD40 repeat protein